jgi:hypothetical protein
MLNTHHKAGPRIIFFNIKPLLKIYEFITCSSLKI